MRPLRIGVSACFFHADPERRFFIGKTLLYLEESMGKMLMEVGAYPVFLPRASGSFTVEDLLQDVDGLLLQGGSDVCPRTYGEEPMRPEWGGDEPRDIYEIELIKKCLEMDRPILGICRGHQVLNVALGGTLYQDINTQIPETQTHRDPTVYDKIFHEITFTEDSKLRDYYPGKDGGKINTVHHQSIKDLGKGLRIEAYSVPDNIIEAVYLEQENEDSPYAYGVQWHPEFFDTSDTSLLDRNNILKPFLAEVQKRKDKRQQ